MNGKFKAGNNIAMKVPPHEFEATVSFYRDIIALEELTSDEEHATPRFNFGGKVLWIDCVEGCSQAEIWLEIVTDNLAEAAEHFKQAGITRCDTIESLPNDFQGFWISSSCNIIHLICGEETT